MPLVTGLLRALVYLGSGGLVGFLFLGEFALNTVPAVQVLLLVLALLGLAGVVRHSRGWEMWPVFVAAALVVPLMIDARVVGLPHCDVVRPGVACFAGSRDVTGQFINELATLGCAIVGVALLIAREMRAHLPMLRR